MTDQIDKLRTLNGELCAEINEKDKRIRELESLVRDMWEYLNDPATEFPCCEPVCDRIRECIRALGMEVD